MYAMRSTLSQKWRDDGLKYKRRGKRDIGLNQFNMGYEVQLGYKGLIFYGKYFPNGIFKSANDPNLRSVSFGISTRVKNLSNMGQKQQCNSR